MFTKKEWQRFQNKYSKRGWTYVFSSEKKEIGYQLKNTERPIIAQTNNPQMNFTVVEELTREEAEKLYTEDYPDRVGAVLNSFHREIFPYVYKLVAD